MSYYIHSVPGRLRIKIPAIKGHAERAMVIQSLLKDIEAVESIRANTVTGSLVVKYQPGRFARNEILSILKENGCFDASQAFTLDHVVVKTSSKAGRALSKAFCGWAVGRALEGTGLSFLAAFI